MTFTLKMSALLAIVFSLQMLMIEGAVTKKPTVVKSKGSCSGINYEKVSKCCKSTPDDFVDKTKLSACTKQLSGSNLAITKEYVLNKLQYDNKTYVLGGKGDNNKINKNALIVDGAVDYDAVTTYVKAKITNANWQTILGDAVATCQSTIETIEGADETLKTVATDKDGFKTCLTAPGILLQCLMGTVIKSCPATSQINSPICLTEIKKFNTCDIFAAAA